MDLREHVDVDNLHHAYVIEDFEDAFEKLQEILRESHKDDEIHIRDFELLGIDDSRELVHMANMRSLGTQLFVCRAKKCTREAQNALLKLLEEPPERTHFFLCISGVQDVLPTLRSRVWMVESGVGSSGSSMGKDFIKGSPSDRAAILEPILKEKDTQAAEWLLGEVEQELHTYSVNSHGKALQHIVDVRRVMKDKGASLKTLLESVAIVVPKLS